MLNEEWLHENLELYAIGALPQAEDADIKARLERLEPDARTEYGQRVSEVQALMHDYSLRYECTPSDTLRARVLADFGARHPAEPHRRRRAGTLLAACALIVAALVVGVVVGRSTAPQNEPPATAEGSAAAVFSAPDTAFSVETLSGSRGLLTVASSHSLNRAVVVVRDLARPLPAERVLQLWSVRDGGSPVPAGLFEGPGAAPLVVDRIDAAKALAVTLEPRGGSSAPTTPILAQVAL